MDGDAAPVVGITLGDPAGIGPEVIAKAFPGVVDLARPVVIGDADVLRRAVELVGGDIHVEPVDDVRDVHPTANEMAVLDLDNVDTLEHGIVSEPYGSASLEYVERAIELARDGTLDAITTAPINKQSIRLAGSEHAGHTGLLAERTDTRRYAMMLIEGPLRVTHVSTHVPLRKACDLVTTENVRETIEVTHEALRELGIGDPTIAVAGLNPHAGDGRLLGDEDHDEIRPAIELARNSGIDAGGPEPPDTVFAAAARGEYDCVVAMYHEQGHLPIKMLGFSAGEAVSGVNVTIGLPIVRTSVDHGTAFDIAGEGVASERSMLDAVETAAELARSRTGANR